VFFLHKCHRRARKPLISGRDTPFVYTQVARLLQLNRIRAEEEAQSAAAAPAAKTVGKRSRKSSKSAPPIAQGALYQDSTE
jgi:type IV secretory pathway VirB9-like protein